MVQLELYIKEPINFLRTVTLKNSHFADHILKNDVAPAYRDILPVECNPYYRHLTGEYILQDEYTVVGSNLIANRELYTRFDEMIYIRSLDTQEQIPFTKAMLEQHPKTASLYRIPNSYYTKLCDRHPQYTDLIKAIVYPVDDIDTAINAENFTLLQYDVELLQENERVSIMGALRTTLNMIRERWTVQEYTYEDMYAITHQAMVWHILYLTIFAQRILNVKTSNVHEFHIWNYLTSKGISDYRDVLTMKQALFLYRNINYLLKNKGTQKNFSILIGSLLAPLNVQLYSKSIIQNTLNGSSATSAVNGDEPTLMMAKKTKSTAAKTVTLTDSQLSSTFANTCKPHPQIVSNTAGDPSIIEQAACLVDNTRYRRYGQAIDVVKGILNDYQPGDGYNKVQELERGSVETTSSVYDKEQESKLEYQDENLFLESTDKQDYQFAVTPHTFLNTKAHEINKSVTSTLYNQVYAKFIEESILYRASEDDLHFNVSIIPPDTKVPVALTAKQALAVLLYCACREQGVELTAPPTEAEVFWPYNKEFADIPEYFYYNGNKRYTKGYLTDYGFTDMTAYPNSFNSAEEMGEQIHHQATNFLSNFIEVHRSSSSCHMEILMKVYNLRCIKGWIKLDLINGKTYKDFFKESEDMQAVVEQYDNSVDPALAYSKLFTELMKVFYPVDTDLLQDSEMTLSDKFGRIKEFFVEMCSYNVTFFDKIQGMTNASHTWWHGTFDIKQILQIVGCKFPWIDPCIRLRIIQTFVHRDTLGFTMNVKGPYEYISRVIWELLDFTNIRFEHIFRDYFILPCCDLNVSGNNLLKWQRRNSDYGDTVEVDLGADPEVFELNDLPKKERTHYCACKLQDRADGTRLLTYTPYPNRHTTNGMTDVRIHLDWSSGDTTGSVTPVYKNGELVEVVVEKVRKWDEVPDYTITEENGKSVFTHITHKPFNWS